MSLPSRLFVIPQILSQRTDIQAVEEMYPPNTREAAGAGLRYLGRNGMVTSSRVAKSLPLSTCRRHQVLHLGRRSSISYRKPLPAVSLPPLPLASEDVSWFAFDYLGTPQDLSQQPLNLQAGRVLVSTPHPTPRSGERRGHLESKSCVQGTSNPSGSLVRPSCFGRSSYGHNWECTPPPPFVKLIYSRSRVQVNISRPTRRSPTATSTTVSRTSRNYTGGSLLRETWTFGWTYRLFAS
jgi:hypothetical protein